MRMAHAGRRLLIGLVAVTALFIAAPASAQTGMVKGKVTDAKNQPIEGAKVTITYAEGMNRKFETKTNKKGEFIQIGLSPGPYQLTAEKDGVSQRFDARVRLGDAATVNFQLVPGQGGVPMTKEEAAKMDALKKALDAGLVANQTGNYDEAIARFTEALAARPQCVSCYYNIGFAHARKKEYDQAEAALKKAIELKPDTSEAYNELATLYNAQKKFDLAAQMSAEAAKYSGGGAGGAASGNNAEVLYNQGVILWNAGKIPDAKKNFEEVVKINPTHADAHYQLGMAYLNEGKMPEAVAAFEKYLELAPTGQYVAQAKGIVGQLKK